MAGLFESELVAFLRRIEWPFWSEFVSRPVVVELGAGTAIPSVRRFSQRIIHEFGGRLVRINPREFSVPTTNDVGLASGARHTLTQIDQVMRASSR